MSLVHRRRRAPDVDPQRSGMLVAWYGAVVQRLVRPRGPTITICGAHDLGPMGAPDPLDAERLVAGALQDAADRDHMTIDCADCGLEGPWRRDSQEVAEVACADGWRPFQDGIIERFRCPDCVAGLAEPDAGQVDFDASGAPP